MSDLASLAVDDDWANAVRHRDWYRYGIDHRWELTIQVMHGPLEQTGEQHLVASACVSLDELAQKQRQVPARATKCE